MCSNGAATLAGDACSLKVLIMQLFCLVAGPHPPLRLHILHPHTHREHLLALLCFVIACHTQCRAASWMCWCCVSSLATSAEHRPGFTQGNSAPACYAVEGIDMLQHLPCHSTTRPICAFSCALAGLLPPPPHHHQIHRESQHPPCHDAWQAGSRQRCSSCAESRLQSDGRASLARATTMPCCNRPLGQPRAC